MLRGQSGRESSCGTGLQERTNRPRTPLLKNSGRLNNGEQKRGKSRKARPPKQVATWKFPAFSSDEKLVWLQATKNQHVRVTRIRHQAAMRMGLPQSVMETYWVRLRFSDHPQYILRAEGVETLECVRPRDERENSRALQPDVIIGWMDWDKVELFIFSG